MSLSDSLWNKYSKLVKITKHSKAWWNKECNTKLNIYCTSKSMADWKKFKRVIKKMKQLFFYEKIQEIASRNMRSLDLINWVKKCKLPAIKALQFNRWLCVKLEDIWQVLYYMFNLAQNWQINLWLLDEVPAKPIYEWLSFFKTELRDAIKKCSSLSMSESNHIL